MPDREKLREISTAPLNTHETFILISWDKDCDTPEYVELVSGPVRDCGTILCINSANYMNPEHATHWLPIQALTAPTGWRDTVEELIDALNLFVPSPRCRDCADSNGACPNSLSGKAPCDPAFYHGWAQSVRDRATRKLLDSGAEVEANDGN